MHFLSLAGALGMTSAGLIAAYMAGGMEPAARPVAGALQRKFGAFGVMAVALLWITGIALLLLRHDLTSLTAAAWIKFALVAVLTGLLITVRRLGAAALASGAPPPAVLIRRIMTAMLVIAVSIVVFATIAFGS